AEVELQVPGWREKSIRAIGRLVPNKTFSGNGRAQPWLDHALHALIARGIGERAGALREAVTAIHLSAIGQHAPPVDLWFFEGLPRIEAVRITSWAGVVGGAVLASFRGLRELDLRLHWSVSADTLGPLVECPDLERITLWGTFPDLSGLRGCGVTTLTLHDRECVDLRDVGAMPRLEEADLRCHEGAGGLDGSPVRRLTWRARGRCALGALRSLEVLDSDTRLDGLTEAPRLHTLSCVSVMGAPLLPLVTSAKVRQVGDEDVASFPNLNALTELDAGTLALSRWADLGGLPALKEVRWRWLSHLESTEGVPAVRAYPHLGDGRPVAMFSLAGCRKSLVSIADLDRLQGIEVLELTDCVGLRSLDGLQGATALRGLDLRGCAGLADSSALDGLDLRAIAISGCPHAVEGGLPESVAWAVTRPASADVGRLARRARPRAPRARAARPKAVDIDEEVWVAVVDAIRGARHATLPDVRRAIAALGTPAYERLLAGASWSSKTRSLRAPRVPIRGNTTVKQALICALVADAPAELPVVRKLREAVTHLTIESPGGHEPERYRSPPLDVGTLVCLRKLRELSIGRYGQLHGIEGLATLGDLEVLELKAKLPDAHPLRGVGVRELCAELVSLDGIDGLASLVVLRVTANHPVVDVPVATLEEAHGVTLPEGALDHLPKLRVASAFASPGYVAPAHESLRELTLRGCDGRIGDLAGFRGLERLVVDLWGKPCTTLGPLPSSMVALKVDGLARGALLGAEGSAVRRVEIEAMDADSAAELARLPALRELQLGYRGRHHLGPLVGTGIERLVVFRAEVLDDVGVLERMPSLRSVRVQSRRSSRAGIPTHLLEAT
ncbi:MAG: hypothetical protein KC621_03790, partial [Myxococcales bacterium]|nr:hypothetical protein [Myxococcales bacterium]